MEGSAPLRTYRCYYCDELGHFQATCPLLAAKQQRQHQNRDTATSQSSTVRCLRCHRFGHLRYQCKKPRTLAEPLNPCGHCGQHGHWTRVCREPVQVK